MTAGLAAYGGACLVLGVQFGRWSLLLLMRRSWRAQQQRQLARREVTRPYVEHAGQYVDRDRVRAGVRLEPPDWFTRAG